MLPAFRAGQYGAGLVAGTTRLIRRIADVRGVPLQDLPLPSVAPDRDRAPALIRLLPLAIILLLLIMRMGGGGGRRRRRGRFPGWYGGLGPFGGGVGGGFGGGGFGGGFGGGGGGGGGFGGFGGFGGGRSGGGGASGRW
jgi:uncharacterized protein